MKSIYICIVVGILGVAQVKSEVLDDLKKVSENCREETKVTEDDMKNFFMGGMKDADAKDNIKCQMKCVMEKQGHFKNGALDADASKKFLQSLPSMKGQQDLINHSIDDCKNEKGSNDCDTAYKITKCMAEHKAKM